MIMPDRRTDGRTDGRMGGQKKGQGAGGQTDQSTAADRRRDGELGEEMDVL